ncbi:hypothetical protein EDB80DRAFT_756664 [Ilyonectria destructans]|nr:hypothetical protein EDB80DRAFT_756664 [Ilyonectria destructans]
MPQQQPTYLPPLQPQTGPGSLAYPPPDQRDGYYNSRVPRGPGCGQEPYSSDPYHAYWGQPDQGPPPPHGYFDENPPRGLGAAPLLTQAAPRQRTSIACNYCRRRKIRCSGYQSAPGGKCKNCARMNQKCIFQPVSSSNSTAFIPVSVVPGGIPPGTQLFGAYGQPLAPGSGPAPHPQGPYQRPPPGAPPSENYRPPVQPPTESLSSYGDARTAGKRRRRTSEEQDEGYRLPPPGAVVEEDRRGRFPAKCSNHSSLDAAPSGRSSTPQNCSSGASIPPRQQGQSFGQQTSKGNPSVMSLNNLLK